MKNKNAFLWHIINTIVVGGVIVYLVIKDLEKTTTAYVVNQEVFAGFKGRGDLNKKLEGVKEKHQKVLDSLYTQLQGNEEELKSLAEKSRKFMEDEQQLSERYTQQVWKQINTYINDYGKEKGHEIIFGANGTGSLMYAREANNITSQVLEYINKRYEGEQ